MYLLDFRDISNTYVNEKAVVASWIFSPTFCHPWTANIICLHIFRERSERKLSSVYLYLCYFFLISITFMYLGVFVWHVCLGITCVPGACRGQNKALDPLNLELQVVVGFYVVLRIARAANTLNHWTHSSNIYVQFNKLSEAPYLHHTGSNQSSLCASRDFAATMWRRVHIFSKLEGYQNFRKFGIHLLWIKILAFQNHIFIMLRIFFGFFKKYFSYVNYLLCNIDTF